MSYNNEMKTWNGQNIEREITISTDPYRAEQLSINEATFRRYMGGRPEVTFNESYFVQSRDLWDSRLYVLMSLGLHTALELKKELVRSEAAQKYS